MHGGWESVDGVRGIAQAAKRTLNGLHKGHYRTDGVQDIVRKIYSVLHGPCNGRCTSREKDNERTVERVLHPPCKVQCTDCVGDIVRTVQRTLYGRCRGDCTDGTSEIVGKFYRDSVDDVEATVRAMQWFVVYDVHVRLPGRCNRHDAIEYSSNGILQSSQGQSGNVKDCS